MSGALSSINSRRRRGYAGGGDVEGQDLGDKYAPTPLSVPYTEIDAARDMGDQGGDNAPDFTPGGGALGGTAPQVLANLRAQQNLSSAAKAQQVQTTLAAASIPTPPAIQAATGTAPGSSPDLMSATAPQNNSGPPSSGSGFYDPSQAPGATNLPMLAAAAAFLKPTHSGTFSEALGNAFSAAIPVAEQQRQLVEQAALRKAQMDNNAAIAGARNDTQNKAIQQRADAANNRLGLIQAQTARQLALADPANRRLSEADLQNKTAQALMGMEDPDDPGHNYTAAKALLRASGIAAKEQNADANTTRAGAAATNAESGQIRAQTGVTNSQTRQTQVNSQIANAQKTLDYKYWKADQDAALAQGKITADEYRSNMTNINAQVVGGVPVGQAVKNVPTVSAAARNNVPGQAPINNPRPASAPPRTVPSGVLDQARDAIAKGAPRDAVVQRLRNMGVDPGGL